MIKIILIIVFSIVVSQSFAETIVLRDCYYPFHEKRLDRSHFVDKIFAIDTVKKIVKASTIYTEQGYQEVLIKDKNIKNPSVVDLNITAIGPSYVIANKTLRSGFFDKTKLQLDVFIDLNNYMIQQKLIDNEYKRNQTETLSCTR
jgi:hypothetical protein